MKKNEMLMNTEITIKLPHVDVTGIIFYLSHFKDTVSDEVVLESLNALIDKLVKQQCQQEKDVMGIVE